MRRKKDYCEMIPQYSKRVITDEGAGLAMIAKLVHKHSQTKASNILGETFLRLMPCLIINSSFGKANEYRQRVRKIQREWKSKHHNRIRGLLFFVDYHLEIMFKKHPHLNIFCKEFYENGINRDICVEYVRDEGEKYRYIYQAYLRQLEEIQ